MKLKEISDTEKTLLTLSGISYEFSEEVSNIEWMISNISGSSRRTLVKNTINNTIRQIEDFLNLGFDNSDADVIRAKEYHSRLSAIYEDFK